MIMNLKKSQGNIPMIDSVGALPLMQAMAFIAQFFNDLNKKQQAKDLGKQVLHDFAHMSLADLAAYCAANATVLSAAQLISLNITLTTDFTQLSIEQLQVIANVINTDIQNLIDSLG